MNDLITLHRKEYGCEPEVVVQAPGIINILGEHTDYNEGFVLQAGLNRTVSVAVSRRKDNSLRFFAADFNERKRTTLANLKYKREDRWANYPKGVIEEFLHYGYAIKGVDITITGNIPQSIGLGSSAALGIASAFALKQLYQLTISETQMVQSAYLAETSFMGLDSEITDPLTACIAKKDSLVFLDLRSLKYEYIQFKNSQAKFLITNSNVPLLSGETELKERKDLCSQCVELLSKRKSGLSLRDYTSQDLKSYMGLIPESTRRICMHVVKENQRVLEAKQYLMSGDLYSVGKLMNRSHESLRDDYEVSCPELDWLVKRAWELDGVYGSRMTGSGFGGCTVTLIKESAIDKYTERLEEYERIFGFNAEAFLCEPSGGVKIVYP